METTKTKNNSFSMNNTISLAFLNDKLPKNGVVLGADIGGTKANLALAEIRGDTLHIVHEGHYRTKDYSSFFEIYSLFLGEYDTAIDAICLGVAGPVIDGKVRAQISLGS